MESSIFRKSSLEKMSSPEQLNDYIKLIRPRSWYVLTGLFVIVIAALIWAFTGTIPDRLSVRGVAFSQAGGADGDIAVYTYLPLTTAKRLSENMQVQVSPDYALREEFGYIYGTISNIGGKLMDESDLIERYGNISYVAGVLPAVTEGNFVEVTIALERYEDNLNWSNPKGSTVALEKGAYCTGVIVTSERKPYELFLKR